MKHEHLDTLCLCLVILAHVDNVYNIHLKGNIVPMPKSHTMKAYRKHGSSSKHTFRHIRGNSYLQHRLFSKTDTQLASKGADEETGL